MDAREVNDAYDAVGGSTIEVLTAWDALWARLSEEETDIRIADHVGEAPAGAVAAWLAGPGAARAEGERRLAAQVLARPDLDALPAAYGPFLAGLRAGAGQASIDGDPALEALVQRWWAAHARWQPAMSAYARDRTEASWRAIGGARAAVASEVSDLWTALAERRAALALAAGFGDVRAWAWHGLGRPWSLADADALCERVLTAFVPWTEALAPREPPWQRAQPAPAPDDLRAAARDLVAGAAPDLASAVDRVRVRVDPRARFAVAAWRPVAGEAVVLLRPTGRDADVRALLHELGRALHSALGRPGAPMRCVDPPLEVAELASYGLVSRADRSAQSARAIVELACSAVAVHRFERWAYANPDATVAERNARWLEEESAASPFGEVTDDTGTGWLRFPHLALRPLASVAYAVSALGALAVRDGPPDRFVAFLGLPPGTPPSDAFAVAGAQLLPDAAALADLGRRVAAVAVPAAAA